MTCFGCRYEPCSGWSGWAETCRWEKQCKDILLIKRSIKQVVFDYIWPIYFMFLYNTTGISHLKVLTDNVNCLKCHLMLQWKCLKALLLKTLQVNTVFFNIGMHFNLTSKSFFLISLISFFYWRFCIIYFHWNTCVCVCVCVPSGWSVENELQCYARGTV